VSGVFPFIFIPRGSGIRLDWLDTIGIKGEEAYSSLTAAVREGELELPKYITVIEPSGTCVHLETSLTQPTRKGVLAGLELEEKETVVVVQNRSVDFLDTCQDLEQEEGRIFEDVEVDDDDDDEQGDAEETGDSTAEGGSSGGGEGGCGDEGGGSGDEGGARGAEIGGGGGRGAGGGGSGAGGGGSGVEGGGSGGGGGGGGSGAGGGGSGAGGGGSGGGGGGSGAGGGGSGAGGGVSGAGEPRRPCWEELALLNCFRNPRLLSASDLFSHVRLTPAQFQTLCDVTVRASITPGPRSRRLTHEARVSLYRCQLLLTDKKNCAMCTNVFFLCPNPCHLFKP
jgi:hypothetical protein